MSFDTAFLGLMASTITIRPRATRNSYGKTTFGTSTTSPARVTYKTRVLRRPGAEDIQASATVWLPPPDYHSTRLISTDDNIILPDGSERAVLSVDRPVDETGAIHHQRVLLA